MVVITGFIWIISVFFVAYGANLVVPYGGNFPYRGELELLHLPRIIYSLANFDGVHYLLIAKNGYQQYEQAYFPLYSIIIRFFTPFFGGESLIAALILNGVFFLCGLILFVKLAKSMVGKRAYWALVYLLVFPTSFFFAAVYTESLFFFCSSATLYFLRKKQYIFMVVFGILASSTRLIGLFLCIPIFITLCFEKKFTNKKIKLILTTLLPTVGFFGYVIYLWLTTGDPIFFFHAQPAFGAHRSTHLIIFPQVYVRYMRILFTSAHDLAYFVSIIEMVTFTVVLGILCLEFYHYYKRKINAEIAFRFGIFVFSLINILLPSLTGTFSSVPRYALFSYSIYFFLAQIESKIVKVFVALVFVSLQIIMLSLFIQGYFVS